MDSSGFHLLIKNFTNLTEGEGAEVKKLSKEFPYSQILHLLRSRAAQDLQYSDKTEILHQSAVYSTDRTVLKSVMTAGRTERISPPPITPPELIDPPKPKIKTPEQLIEIMVAPSVQAVSTQNIALVGDALREDLYRELEKLQRLKHEFEVSVDDYNKSRDNGAKPTQVKEVKEPVADPLLEEIKTTKRKLKVDGTKQKEQNEIIDQFIKTKPVLSKPKPVEPTTDLSEDSGVFSDNIVSETLVTILLKQGKKDKAIEVLKKLIWKFPQKKAYFAAQIENLKN